LVWGVWSGFTWLRIGAVGGLLWMRWWTFGFWRHGASKLVFVLTIYLNEPLVKSRQTDFWGNLWAK
jgi:hypothetical protein